MTTAQVGPVITASLRVPYESPSGHAPVPVPGLVRLSLELMFFGFAAWGLFNSGATQAAVIFGGMVLVHYGISYDRVWRLLKH